MSGPEIGDRSEPAGKENDGGRPKPEAPKRDGETSRGARGEGDRNPLPGVARRPPGRLPQR